MHGVGGPGYVPAEIIEFPRAPAPHGLSRADIAELQHGADQIPGAALDPSYEGDHSRLWLRFSGPRAGLAPVFGFARREGLIWVVARRLGPDFPDGGQETPFASGAAAIMSLLEAIQEVQPEWWPPDPSVA
jgi:hypothetical protein